MYFLTPLPFFFQPATFKLTVRMRSWRQIFSTTSCQTKVKFLSSFYFLSLVGSRKQVQERNPDIPLPSNNLQFVQGIPSRSWAREDYISSKGKETSYSDDWTTSTNSFWSGESAAALSADFQLSSYCTMTDQSNTLITEDEAPVHQSISCYILQSLVEKTPSCVSSSTWGSNSSIHTPIWRQYSTLFSQTPPSRACWKSWLEDTNRTASSA